MPQKKQSDLRTVGMMMIIMMAGKILGAVRNMFHGASFGTEDVAGNAFLLASFIPRQFLDIMFAAVFSASFIPVFNTYLTKKGRAEADKLAANFISIIIVLTTAVTGLCIVFSGEIFRLLAAGVNQDVQALGIQLLRIMFVTLIMSGVAFSLTGILQSMGEFNIPAAMSVASNSIIIIYYCFFIDRFGVYGLCVAFLLGWLSQVLIQLPFLAKNHFHFHFHIDVHDPGIREIVRLVLPVMVSTWAAPVNIWINVMAVSHLYGGTGQGASALQYAYDLYAIITGVFILSVSNVIFPKLSKLNTLSESDQFGDTLQGTLRSLFFILIPMSMGLMALSYPLVRLFYERERFTALSSELTSTALFFFSVGILGYGLQTILSRAFFSMKDGRTPLVTGIVSMLLNGVLSFAFVGRLGVGGPALASAISITVVGCVMLWIIYRRNARVLNKALWADVMKIALVSGAMVSVTLLVKNSLQNMLPDNLPGRFLLLSLSTLAGVVVYMGGTAMLRVNEALVALKLVKNALGRR